MLGEGVDMSLIKYGAGCIITLLMFIIIMIIKLITNSYIFGIVVCMLLVWFLVFKIGIAVMYPGSSSYFTSDIQIRMGNQFIKNLQHLGLAIQFIAQHILERKTEFILSQLNAKQKILGIIHNIVEMLSMFENNLSPRKTLILDIFRNLLEEFYGKNLSSIPSSINEEIHSLNSIIQFMQYPKRITRISEEQHKFLCQRIKKIILLNNNLQRIVQTYKPPGKTFESFKFKFFQQKFYQIRFGFQRWNNIFQYEMHLINNYGYILQCAVIRKCKNFRMLGPFFENSEQVEFNGKYVLFCNPNGVYIQFFAVQNSYIQEYLRQGYRVIMWNYRGYGQSTGSPTITKSQTDALKVYHYFTEKGMNIQLVHGYSIGGCAAIGLVSKLQKREKEQSKPDHRINPQLRAETLPNNIKLLIVDRSFSSIGDMAIQFGLTLHSLACFAFMFENKNLSQQFYELNTEKLLIWDKYDEVIPDTASVKFGILMNMVEKQTQSRCKSCTNCIKIDHQNNLNEEVSVLINQKQDQEGSSIDITKKFTQRFINSLQILLLAYSGMTKPTDVQLDINHEFKIEQKSNQLSSEHLSIVDQIINQVFNTLQLIDGGGVILPHPVDQFKKLLTTNSFDFICKCKSYIIGLAFYGSVMPVDVAFQQKTKIQLHTINKIEDAMKNLNKILENNSQATQLIQPGLTSAIQNIIKTYREVKHILEEKFLQPQGKKFGKLVALSSGHNGSLPKQQLKLLMKFAQQVCAHNQDSNPLHQDFVDRLQGLQEGSLERSTYLNQINENNHSTEITVYSEHHNNFLD